MKPFEPICVQIAALGGQGGGVLAGWLADAARIAGYPAQSTSIPGVAQRTGATTYYFEMMARKDPDKKPLFSLFPDQDGLDLMVAMEPLEAVRALELGLITKRTVVLTAVERIYSTAEKSVAGDGAIASTALIQALEGAAKKLIVLDVDQLASRPGAPGNGVVFGAIAATGILPVTIDDFHAAIRNKGIAVDASQDDFVSGFNHAGEDIKPSTAPDSQVFDRAPERFENDISALPEFMRPLVGHTLARLLDYQDPEYGHLYLTRLKPFLDCAPDVALEVAKRLGAWMSYEDVIRVAQLKTRPGRLMRIRNEIGIDGNDPFTVIDFLKPGIEELAGLMPPVLGRFLMRFHSADSTGGMKLRLRTSRFYSFALLKLLAFLKYRRRNTYRYHLEQAAIEKWLQVLETAKDDPQLSRLVAELAVLARGYGGVRARGTKQLQALFDGGLQNTGGEPEKFKSEAAALLYQARHDADKNCGKM